MKKYIRGFLMAWGNFSAVPRPYHKWHEDSRKAMLAMLPLVGLMLAVIVCAAWWLLDLIGVHAILTGAVLTALYFIANGFIHLDGFMDCSDAILSRRPELEERQRILKASDVGAFAVISVMLMSIIFAASMMTLAEEFCLEKASMLVVIMLVSRGFGADAVLRKTPMKTSQYIDLDKEAEIALEPDANKKKKAREQGALNLTLVIPLLAIYYISSAFEAGIMFAICHIAVVCIVALAAGGAGVYARKQLGGMNGDIAGYMVVMSETIGVFSAAILTSVLM
ncbi:MAG: adenosylcobinamide-GDP ribazoletransferase [Bacillota bacterium]|nr:adenosylcobinamide-GDP ribazoletransferase [Bacillota bacterium]